VKIRSSILLWGLWSLAAAAPLWAGGTCNTAPIAADDTVQVGYGSFHLFDPLSLNSIGGGAGCAGSVAQLGRLARFTPDGSALPGGATSCSVGYSVTDGHVGSSGSVTLLFPPGAIFSDGFESGNTSAWDEIVPGS